MSLVVSVRRPTLYSLLLTNAHEAQEVRPDHGHFISEDEVHAVHLPLEIRQGGPTKRTSICTSTPAEMYRNLESAVAGLVDDNALGCRGVVPRGKGVGALAVEEWLMSTKKKSWWEGKVRMTRCMPRQKQKGILSTRRKETWK